jgi:hypothetical protein
MAEPTTSTESPSAAESKPKLVALDPEPAAPRQRPGSAPAPAPAGRGRERKGSQVVGWLLLCLLVVSGVWGVLQAQQVETLGARNMALSEQIQGLEVQLSATNLQIQSYEMQQDLIRSVTADLAAQVGRLQALVDPAPPPAIQTEGF